MARSKCCLAAASALHRRWRMRAGGLARRGIDFFHGRRACTSDELRGGAQDFPQALGAVDRRCCARHACSRGARGCRLSAVARRSRDRRCCRGAALQPQRCDRERHRERGKRRARRGQRLHHNGARFRLVVRALPLPLDLARRAHREPRLLRRAHPPHCQACCAAHSDPSGKHAALSPGVHVPRWAGRGDAREPRARDESHPRRRRPAVVG